MYRNFFKRLFDLIAALAAFLLLSPIFLVTTVLLSFANSGKPFFFQSRPGKAGRVFRIFKFKTMNDRKSANGELLSDAERLTSIGKIVRKLSLDEIPQLLNVIKGDMSLVGPRPLLVEYLPLYSEKQAKRHDVLPGITGWAQVNGRNTLDWSTKFEYDVWYVENLSLWLDLRILTLTLKKVFKKEGISADNSATMEKFRGN
ncbi:MAG: sugar transferase [Cytophagia bacterium]|nr:sugar transferase [Cytophagia bacterium]